VIHILYNRVMILACSLVLLAGCGSPPSSVKQNVQPPVSPLTCIGVLPAVPGIDSDGKTTPEKQKNLQQGAKVMNMLLSQELGGQDKITFVSDDHISGLQMSGGENLIDIARLVGKSINCNAILETKVWRYTERIGTKWSVEKPAAVAFDFRLIGTDSGNVLWSAKFDEEQIPVMENLYNWSKAKTRGFTWITADELMLEGVREKMSNSPYFKQLLQRNIKDKSLDYYDDKV